MPRFKTSGKKGLRPSFSGQNEAALEQWEEENNQQESSGQSKEKEDNEDESNDNQSEEQWEVEKIIKKKKIDGQIKYLVKWVGWSDNDNTWEPIEHLENVKQMVEEFEKNKVEKQPQQQQPSTKKAEKIQEKEVASKAFAEQISSAIQCEDDENDQDYNPEEEFKQTKDDKKYSNKNNNKEPEEGEVVQNNNSKPNDKSESESNYEVESVIGKRELNGVLQYQIKWQGFQQTTWENADLLDQIKDMVELFEQKEKKKLQEQQKKQVITQKNQENLKIKKILDPATQKQKQIASKPSVERQIPSTSQQVSQQSTTNQRIIKKVKESQIIPAKSQSQTRQSHSIEPRQQQEETITTTITNLKVNDNMQIESNKNNDDDANDYAVPEIVDKFEEGSFYKKDRLEKLELYNQTACELPENLFYKIIWKQRKDGFQPSPSYASYSQIKKYEPYQLIAFWEELYKQNNSQNQVNDNKQTEKN